MSIVDDYFSRFHVNLVANAFKVVAVFFNDVGKGGLEPLVCFDALRGQLVALVKRLRLRLSSVVVMVGWW